MGHRKPIVTYPAPALPGHPSREGILVIIPSLDARYGFTHRGGASQRAQGALACRVMHRQKIAVTPIVSRGSDLPRRIDLV